MRVDAVRGLVAAAAVVVSVVGGASSARAADAPIPVAIGWNKVAGQLIGPVAAAKGFGKDYGIDLKLQPFGGSADAMQSTITGAVDGCFGATVPTGPSLIQNGAPIKSVLIYAYGGDRLALVTMKSTGITSTSQLAGKRIAGPLGNTAQQVAEAMVVAAGLNVKAVGLVNMDYPDLPAALSTKQVDAAVFAEPTLSAFLAKEPNAVVLERAGKYLAAAASLFMSDKLRKAPNDAAYKTYLTFARASQYIRQKGADSDEIAQILADATGLSLSLAKVSAKGTVFDPRIKPWIWEQTQNDMNFFVSTGKLKGTVTEAQLFDLSLQARALKEHPELFSDLDDYLKRLGATPAQLRAP